MRRAGKWLLGILLALLLLPLVLAAVVLVALNTAPGQGFLARQIASLTGGTVVISGLHGGLPGGPRIDRIELRDSQGVWLTVDHAALDWSPLALISGDAHVTRLAAQSVSMPRLPVSNPASTAAPSSSGTFQLPVRVDADEVHVGRIDLGPAVAGAPIAASLDGSAHLASLQDGDANVLLRAADGSGTYHLRGHIDPAAIRATLRADEAAHGMVAGLAHLPDLGALGVRASVDGPWTAAVTQLALTAGGLAAGAHGTVDLRGHAADLDVTAHAPAMAPAPGIAFQDVALQAHVHGPFAAPDATGTLHVDGLQAKGAAVRALSADIAGNLGNVRLTATAEGVRIPGPKPGLLESDPLALTAQVNLADPHRPATFDLRHKLLRVSGTAQTAGTISVKAHVEAPDLAPFAAIGGVDLQGRTALDITAALPNGVTDVAVDGTLGITGGIAPAPALIGPDATLGVTASLHGGDVTLSRLKLDGAKVRVAATGGLTAGKVDASADVTLSDLHAIQPTLSGNATLRAHASGPTNDLAAQLRLAGDIATKGLAPGHVEASVDATGLPAAPAGHVQASGMLDGSPVNLAADVARAADGAMSVTISRADWKSAHADGALALAKGATLPTGHIALRMARLDDLRRLSGQALTGSVDADVTIAEAGGHTTAQAKVRADHAGLPGKASVARLALDARVTDPLAAMSVDATLAADGVRAGQMTGNALLRAVGPQTALAIRAQASGQNIAGGPAQFSTQATLDVPRHQVAIAALQATARGQTVRLLAPARVTYGAMVSVDRLRLGLRQAVLEIAGRVSPTLDVTARLSNVTADLARIADPGLQASGTLSAEARLTGAAARPSGTVHVMASGLHLRSGPAAALPPASIAASATLSGSTARIDARLAAGRDHLTVTGTAPIDPAAAMDLRATGGINLGLLDPILAAEGRRARGTLSLDATVTGTLAAPRASGSVQLAGGEFQDFAQGIHVTDIQALIQAAGDRVQIARFSAKAGPGTITASGSVGLAAPMPVDLHLAMRRARPLASDLLTATLDADLALRGQAQGRLDAGGTITIDKADINIPDKLPTSVAVLDVRVPGQKPPPPPGPGPDIGLNLTVNAPGRIFVRGRGLYAELQGKLHLGGTAAAPVPSGGFEMRRGSISVAGTTLTFTTGKVAFDGSGKFDPTLDFVASNTSGNVTSNLDVGGYASDPKITLSSTPPLPQDEVLAHLLFGQSAASLGPFQLAEIAASLAQLTGASGGFDPLGSARQALGLDRLSVGGGSTGGSSASVEAGKYVAPGVYVGAKQATSGGGSQAQVQVDITKRLKLETDVGTGGSSATGAAGSTSSSGTGVGLTYQFEY